MGNSYSGLQPMTMPAGMGQQAMTLPTGIGQHPMSMPAASSYAAQPAMTAGPTYGAQPAWAAVSSRPGSVVPPATAYAAQAVASNAFPQTTAAMQPAFMVPTTMPSAALLAQPAAAYAAQPAWAAVASRAMQPPATLQPATMAVQPPTTLQSATAPAAPAYRGYAPPEDEGTKAVQALLEQSPEQVRAAQPQVPQQAPSLQPVFNGMAPMMTMMPQMPRDVIVDRPFPVFPQYPVPVMHPGMVTHTWNNFNQTEINDFPYHDPAYGMGWRHHYPDDVDDSWMGGGMYSKTPFQQLLDRREEETWQDLWEDAHMGVSEHGWRHRPVPFSRRVRDPEGLIPKQRDFYTELLL